MQEILNAMSASGNRCAPAGRRRPQMPKSPQRCGLQGLYRSSLDACLVEAAGIEPASASPLPSDLHAYSAFYLTGSYPTDRDN